jgi:hypothetical protein
MREIHTHKVNGGNEKLVVEASAAQGPGGAPHHYRIRGLEGNRSVELDFQNGPVPEVGTNGITHEALLAVLIDRLEGFQNGPYACEENETALDHLRKGLEALHDRTLARISRGVEGTDAV